MLLVAQDNKFIAKPNNSLSQEGFIMIFACLLTITLIVAVGVASAGAWYVLPFAGLEVLAFGYAFYYISLHYDDYESIALEGDHLILEKCARKQVQKFSFQRYWVNLSVRDLENGKCGLFISSHGKEVEFGRGFINDEQKLTLLSELKWKLKEH
jgi:uncharacterized membrane protein